MTRGRKKKPEAQHRLQGTYRKDRANPKAPKAPAVLVPEEVAPLAGGSAPQKGKRGKKPEPVAQQASLPAKVVAFRPLVDLDEVPEMPDGEEDTLKLLAAAAARARAEIQAGHARTHWDATTGELVAMGVLTALDLPMMTAAAQWWGVFQAALADMRNSGTTIVLRDKDGEVRGMVNHPAVARANLAFRNWRSAASELGLSPAARERLHTKETPEKDPFAEWLAQGKEQRDKKTAAKAQRA